MNEAALMSFSAVANLYGVSRATIRDIVRGHGLTPKDMTNGQAKGLDRNDLRVIRKALGKEIKAIG